MCFEKHTKESLLSFDSKAYLFDSHINSDYNKNKRENLHTNVCKNRRVVVNANPYNIKGDKAKNESLVSNGHTREPSPCVMTR